MAAVIKSKKITFIYVPHKIYSSYAQEQDCVALFITCWGGGGVRNDGSGQTPQGTSGHISLSLRAAWLPGLGPNQAIRNVFRMCCCNLHSINIVTASVV
jgi:hypothetical protein